MLILLAGGSGFLGTALRVRLADEGHQVRRLVRQTPVSTSEFHWDPTDGRFNALALDNVDVVINLAGPGVFTRPWTTGRRKYLRSARLQSTGLLAEQLIEHTDPDRRPLWLQASSAGWYGTRSGPEPYDESAPAAGDFPARMAEDWEAATTPALEAGITVAFLRSAMVLDRSGSTLKQIRPVFGAGLGAKLGTGRQRMAMISRHDWLRAVLFLLRTAHTDQQASGPYNLTIPEPPTNAEFSRTLARLLGSRIRFGAPAPVLRAALGELAEQLVGSQHLVPGALTDAGFSFDGPDVESTLRLALHQA